MSESERASGNDEFTILSAGEEAEPTINQREDGCGRCPWGKRAGKKVPGYLPGGSDLLIVGEGPGFHEQMKGVPFVGPSGQLLKDSLARAGIDYKKIRVGVTNATLCKPPEGEKFDDACLHACQGRLIGEVYDESPRYILALGSKAARALIGPSCGAITEIHGLAHDSPHKPGQIIIPCLHPAAILRSPKDMAKFDEAIAYAVGLVQGDVIRRKPEPTKWKLVKMSQLEETVAALEKLPEGTYISADIETTGLNPRLDKIITVGISYAQGKALIFHDGLFEHPAFKRLIESKRFRWIWANGKFDVKFLRCKGFNARVDEDIMLMHYALDELSLHDLENLSNWFLGAPDYKHVVEKYKKTGWAGCPKDILCKYQAEDADFTRQLFFIFKTMMETKANHGLWDLYRNILIPASHLLTWVELNGIKPSKDRINAVREALKAKRDEAYRRVQEAVQMSWPKTQAYRNGQPTPLICGKHSELNPNSPKQVYDFLYNHLLMPQAKGYPKNTAETTLLNLPYHPALEAIIEFRGLQKAIGTSCDGIEKRIDPITGRIHSTFQIHVARTGRLSSRDPNIQNVPRDPFIKGIYQAEDGRWLLECDESQAELRILALITKDPALLQIYREGRKLHHEVCVAIYGEHFNTIPEDEWTLEMQDQYIRSKAVNFGIMYGRREHSLAKEFKIPLHEAKMMIQVWFERFPIAYAFIQKTRQMALQMEEIISNMGRRKRPSLVTEQNMENLQNEANNFPIQGPASDINLLAAYNVMPLVEELGGKIVNLVHDSILFEIPPSREVAEKIATTVAEEYKRICAHYMGDEIPMLADYKLGTVWGELKKFKIGAPLPDSVKVAN